MVTCSKKFVKSVDKNMERVASVHRKTKETDIRVELNLDGTGRASITIGVPFLEHMLELFAKSAASWKRSFWIRSCNAPCTRTGSVSGPSSGFAPDRGYRDEVSDASP